MYKRELKINLKSFLIWTSILILMYILVFAMYPHIMSTNTSNQIQELMKVFPKEVLSAFNLDLADMSTSLGWLKTEGSIFVILIYGLYSAILGANILLKEENDKTIEFLYSKPISKNKIITNKILASITYIILMAIITTICVVSGLAITGDLELKICLLLCLIPLIPALVFFFLLLFISTFFKKTKHTTGIALAIVFISYFLSTFSSISETTEFLKYASIYSLADIRNVVQTTSYNPICLIIGIFLIFLFAYLTYYSYNEKDFS